MAINPNDADRNLLFGILALQNDMISRDQLVEGMNAWVLEKATPLARILVEKQFLGEADFALIDPLVERHIARHGGDVQKSLGGISSAFSAADALQQVEDDELQKSLLSLKPPISTNGDDLPLTASFTFPADDGIRYRVVRPHAKGGLGEVFIAQDTELGREVALKEIQGQYSHDASSRSRFLVEAEITGKLEHPGVVPVYGLGSYSDGRPFYAMRFIRGDSMQEAITQFHKNLPTHFEFDVGFRKLLGRFTDVCNAVGYAHSRGVLHRDLKPDNIMLGKYGETLVVDWGLAKHLGHRESTAGKTTEEQTLQISSGSSVGETIAGTAIGTPGYMSPEQAEGKIDQLGPATDVYALGATLYCLLAGSRPIKEKNYHDILVKTTKGDFSPPREINSRIPKPLEAICLKAMKLQPGDRYSSCEELAEDVERWLAGEPVSAYQEPFADRAKRWVRTHRTLATSVVGMLIVAVIGLLIGSALLDQTLGLVRQEKTKTTLALEEAEKQRSLAVTEREEADNQRNKAIASSQLAIKRFDEKRVALEQMLQAFSDEKLKGMQGTQEIRKVLFERGVKLYEDIFQENQNNPTVQLGLADRYVELGRLQSEIGSLDLALEPLRKSESVLRKLLKQDPDNTEYRFKLATTLYEIGYCFWEHNQSDKGMTSLRDSIQILSGLLDSNPQNVDYRLKIAQARTRLAGAVMNKSPNEKEELEKQAYESLKKLAAEEPNNPNILIALARVTCNSGFQFLGANNYKLAETYLEEGKLLLEQSIKIDHANGLALTTLQFALRGLSTVYRSTNRLPKAVELLTQVRGDMEQLAIMNPAVVRYQQTLVWLHDELRKAHQQSKNDEQAIKSLNEIIRLSEGLAQRNPQNAQHVLDRINATRTIAEIFKNSKQESEAISVLDNLIAQSEKLMKQHPVSDDVLGSLLKACITRAELSFNTRDYKTSRKIYEGGVDLYGKTHAGIDVVSEYTHYEYLQCCGGLIQIAKEEGDIKLGIALAEKLILPMDLKKFTYSHYQQALLGEQIVLSSLYEDEGRIKEAIHLRVQAVAESKRILAGDNGSNCYLYQYVHGAHHHLARMYKKNGDEQGEFQALRNYLSETEPYVRERDHSELLKETMAFSKQNLDKLRAAHEKYSLGGMKRFTVPVSFDGVKFPFHIYVSDSWKYFEDQITWVEKIRGGKFPEEVKGSFQRLYKIGKDNKVSWQDLCVYALGAAAASMQGANSLKDGPIGELIGQLKVEQIGDLTKARLEIQTAENPTIAKKNLALIIAKLAEEEIAGGKYFRASHLISEAKGYVDLNSLGRVRDPKDLDVFVYIQYVDGALLACTGQHAKGYDQLLESLQTQPRNVSTEFAVPVGNREFALGWTSLKLKRPVEAASWYQKAMELNHPFAAQRFYEVYKGHKTIGYFVSQEIELLFSRAEKEATEKEPAPVVFARLSKEHFSPKEKNDDKGKTEEKEKVK